MLDYHKANNADITIAAMPVPIEEASRFGVVITDENNRITEFEEKPNILRPRRIGTELSHDVLNPARVPL